MLNTSKIDTEHTGENNCSYAESVRYTYINTPIHIYVHKYTHIYRKKLITKLVDLSVLV